LPRPTKRCTSSSKMNNKKNDSIISACVHWYSTKLDTHPIITKSLTSGLISGGGDFVCQALTQSGKETVGSDKEEFDIQRTGRFAALGAFWVGPALHYWYNILFRALPNHVVARVVLDQSVFAPISCTTFLSILWTWEGEKLSTLGTRLQNNIPSIVVANWVLWIPAQMINFKFVRVEYQVLFSNAVALIWNAYLSYSSKRTNSQKLENDKESPGLL